MDGGRCDQVCIQAARCWQQKPQPHSTRGSWLQPLSTTASHLKTNRPGTSLASASSSSSVAAAEGAAAPASPAAAALLPPLSTSEYLRQSTQRWQDACAGISGAELGIRQADRHHPLQGAGRCHACLPACLPGCLPARLPGWLTPCAHRSNRKLRRRRRRARQGSSSLSSFQCKSAAVPSTRKYHISTTSVHAVPRTSRHSSCCWKKNRC